MRITTAILVVLIATAASGFAARTDVPRAENRPLAKIVPLPRMSPEAQKAEIQKILSQPEFSGSQSGLWERIKAWFGRAAGQLLKSLFGSAAGSASGAKWISITLAIVVLLLFLALLGYVLSKIGLGNLIRPREIDVEELYAGPDTPNLALEEASRAAGVGDYRTALRLVYLAVLLRLDERDLIRFDRTGTNWEYLSALRPVPEIHEVLRPVTVTFDRKWYGRENAAEGDYRSFLDAYQAVDSREVSG